MASEDAVLDFIESSPPGLFPENPESNFGTVIRERWTGRISDLIDQQDTIYNERFVSGSVAFLDEWEIQAGVPPNPVDLDVGTRQAIVLGRIRKGRFTRALRRSIVENYLGATFGTPAALSPSGIAFSAGGVPLYAESVVLATAYEIVEDIPSFIYHIYIDSALTPAAGMTRELTRVTPAGIAYDVTYVVNPVPTLYWKLNDPVGSSTARDLSPYARTGTTVLGITFGQAQSPDKYTSALFADAGSYIRSTYAPFVVGSSRTFMGWAYRLATTNQDTIFMDQSDTGPKLYATSGSEDVYFRTISSNAQSWALAWPGLNQWVHWALTYNDTTKIAELFINGVSKGTKTMSAAYAGTSTNFQLSQASTLAFNGNMRDVVVYERILPTAEILSYAHGWKLT